MLLGRLRIRGKLAVLVIIPLLSMAALAVPVVMERVDAAGQAAKTADTVRTGGRVGTIVQDLQQERLLSIGYLLGVVDRSRLIGQSTSVTDQIADLRLDLGSDLPGPLETALTGVQRLTDLRAAVLAHRATADQIMTTFGAIHSALIDSLQLTTNADTATRTGRQMVALDAVLRTDESISASGTYIVLVVATKNQTASMRYISSMAAMQVTMARFRAFATADQNALYRLVQEAVAARTSNDFLAVGAVNPAAAVAGMSLTRLFPAVASLGTLGQFVEKKIVADVVTGVTEQQQRALTTAYTVGILVLLVLLVVVALSLAVARTVARPLTGLTVSADWVARVTEAELVRVADDETETPNPIRLDPVEVRARDEIGDLARAFDRVQRTAARLVERQAASRRNVAQMFGHVGRRTQNLVGRQIALIDRLEQQETDPSRLQHLYRLDHVSNRLRRNASSLVVLSGSAGSDGHVAPLPLGDIVRLALGEIEDFTRVDVQVRNDVLVAPAAIGDLVLTLAELMENATAFSPPHTRVSVAAEGTETGVRLTLVDHGIGMPAQRLAEENSRLTRRERLDLAPTEVLGLFVVGRLARRHGWQVVLSATSGGGVTVELEIDARLLIVTYAEPSVVAVARASVPSVSLGQPATAGTATAPPLPPPLPPPLAVGAGPVPEAGGTGPVVPAEAAFDSALLTRANHSLATGEPWDAFAPHIAGPAELGAAGPGTAGPGTAGAAARGTGEPATAPVAGEPGRPIRQRVPGAQLPAALPAGNTGRDPGRAPTDPSVVRALIEEFEAGVRRAQRLQPGAAEADPPAPPIGSAVPRLNQRIPGANLSITAPSSHQPQHRTGQEPADPDEVRRLIQQFEAGVARALHEVGPDHRHEEESSR